MRHWPVIIALLVGIALTAWVIAMIDFQAMLDSMARVGVGGFLLLCLGLIGVLILLGAALLASMPGEPARKLPLFFWCRCAREAASDLLPFSQIGGLFVGARVLLNGGIASARVYAAMIVDLTTEMLAQLLFTLFGLGVLSVMLLDPETAEKLRPLAWAGAAAAMAITLAFIFLQRPALRFMGLIASRVIPDAGSGVERVLDQLAIFYRHRGAMAASLFLNLLAWTASAANAWLILRLIGEPLPFVQVVALESLIFALRSAAFLIPGALGVQEAAYVVLGPVFGLPPTSAVTLSLVKRAREIAIALPSLIIWQLSEVNQLRRPGGGRGRHDAGDEIEAGTSAGPRLRRGDEI
jgi:putative membrane protein